jgi:hypothetical protein
MGTRQTVRRVKDCVVLLNIDKCSASVEIGGGRWALDPEVVYHLALALRTV